MPLSGDAQPHSKEAALKAGRPRRYRRKVAGPKQWAALRAEKLEGQLCRLLSDDAPVPAAELHHLIGRDQGGDDVADNLVPICRDCHQGIEKRYPGVLQLLAASLTDAEYAYIVGKLGEGGPERLFGVERDA